MLWRCAVSRKLWVMVSKEKKRKGRFVFDAFLLDELGFALFCLENGRTDALSVAQHVRDVLASSMFIFLGREPDRQAHLVACSSK